MILGKPERHHFYT